MEFGTWNRELVNFELLSLPLRWTIEHSKKLDF